MPKASIIITTHNRPHLLPRAIASACASGQDVEVIVVDDASSDETASICQSTRGITYVRLDRNQGVAGARNVGLVASRGEYISFLDDDDVRLPNSLDEQIEALRKTPDAMLCYAKAIPAVASGKQSEPYPSHCPQGDIFWKLLVRNFIPCGTVVVRRTCVSRVGLLDDSIPGIDDWDIWIRIVELFPVIAMEMPVIVWRQSTPASAQGSSRTVELIALGRRRFRDHWMKLPRVVNATRAERHEAWRAFSRNIAEHLTWETLSALRQGQARRGLTSAQTLLRLHPGALLSVLRRWTRASTIINLMTAGTGRNDLANAKTRFKQIRSDAPRQ